MIMTFLVVYCMSTPKEFKGKVTNIENSEKASGIMIVANKVDTTYTDSTGVFVLKNTNGIKSLDFNTKFSENNNFILVGDSVDVQIDKTNKVLCMKK